MVVKGTFDVTAHPEPPYDTVDGVALGRIRFDKRFVGPLDATSEVHMIGVRTPADGSGGYVAIERVTGSVDGKRGTFVLQHTGVMRRGARTLAVIVVPYSGTGGLAGISGRMDIQIADGKHLYEFDYQLGG